MSQRKAQYHLKLDHQRASNQTTFDKPPSIIKSIRSHKIFTNIISIIE